MTAHAADTLPDSSQLLIEQITELAAHIHAATYRLLVLIRELDRRRIWANHGCNSCAHWLSWQCGIGLNAGREKVRVAHALEQLPKISEAFRGGEISYSKVRAMTRVATPENEDELMNVAWYGTAAHVEKLSRYYRQAREAEDRDRINDRHARRALKWFYDDDGSLVIQCRLDPEDGARVIKALNCAIESLDDEPEDVSAETYPSDRPAEVPHSAKRADALVLMAETLMAKGACRPPPGERFEVTVHMNADGGCETDSGHALSADTARRLGCDGALVGMIEDGDGEVLSVGRRTRAIPPALKRALNARDRGCRFPGCTNTRFVEGHHVKHWADGGETKLSNLVTLCTRHHRLVHEGGFQVKAKANGFEFYRQSGEPIPPAGTFPRKLIRGTAALKKENRSAGLKIDENTGAGRWDGVGMDWDVAIHALFEADGLTDTNPVAPWP